MEAPFLNGENSYDVNAECFRESRRMDSAIRCAESENDPEKFREVIDKAYDPFERVNNSHTLCLLMLLMKKGNSEFIEILKEKLKEWDESYQPFRGFSSLVDMGEIINAMGFMSDEFIAEGYSPRQSMGFMPLDYINTPLYHAMIKGNSDHIEKYIDIALENGTDLTVYMLSAICFKDTDFLRIAFQKGVPFDSGLIASFCCESETVSYLCRNFSEYIFPNKSPDDDPEHNIQDFIRLTVSEKKLLPFAKHLYDDIGYEKFSGMVDKIPKAHIMTHSIAQSIFYDSLGLVKRKNILEEKSFTFFLKDLLSENIIFIAENSYSSLMFDIKTRLNEVGVNVNILYDIFSCGGNCFLGQNLRTVRKFLKENNISANTLGFPSVLTALLDYNDEIITKSLINNFTVTEDNIRRVVEYLTENKLYKALNAINKFYTPIVI